MKVNSSERERAERRGGKEGGKERAGSELSDKEWKSVGKLQLRSHTEVKVVAIVDVVS